MGYLNDPEQTAAAMTHDGFLRSGDVGHIDADGFLCITGRRKELIVTAGGENVAPVRGTCVCRVCCTILQRPAR